MRRYYACIVGKYGAPVQKALAKVGRLPVETLCATHGPVWQREIARVIDLYDRLSRYEGEPGAVIAYGSMYGNTARMAERIARSLAEEGIRTIKVYDLSYAEPSEVLRDVFRYDTLVVGSPTYNGGLFPPVAHLLEMIAERCVPQRRFAWFGSYTWAGAAVRCFAAFAERMKWTAACEAAEMKQGFADEDCDRCCALARSLAAAMKR